MGRVVECYSPGEALEGAVVDTVEGEVLDEPEADVLARPGSPSVKQ